MDYKLVITEKAEHQLEGLVYYLLFQIKNEQAAAHLLDEVSNIYDRIEENPFQFPECRNAYLKSKQYREATTMAMNYVVIYRMDEDTVYVLGVFHGLESYESKV